MSQLSGQRVAGAVDNKAAGGGAAASQATVDAGTNNTEFVSPLTLLSALTVARPDNIFINGSFDVWQRTTNDTTVSTTRKYVADMWHVVTGSGTLTNVQRSTTVRSGALSKYSLEMVGTAGVGAVEIGQRIWNDAAAKYKRTVAFSVYIYNGSGAAFTPKLYARTPSAANNWTTNTAQNGGGFGEDLQSCADAAWTQVTWSADISGYTDIDNGFGITIQIPSGSLVASDTVRFAEFNLTPGSAFPPMKITTFDEQYPLCLPYAWVLDASSDATDQGFGTRVSSTTQSINFQFPMPMKMAPALTHNISGYTAGAPTTTTIGIINYNTGAFYTISGALTVFVSNPNKQYSAMGFTAGTSWSGTTGDISTLRIGPDVVAVFAPSVTVF